MLNSVTFADMEFEHPLMNSGGTCKTLEDVRRFARSAVSAVLVNMLVSERSGNEGDTYWSDRERSLNSKGLPSPGEFYYRQNLPQMVETVHAADKKIGVNISGFEPWEYARLAKIAADAGVDFIELNFGCPNLWEGTAQKVILSFHPGRHQASSEAGLRRRASQFRLWSSSHRFPIPAWSMSCVAC